MILSNETNDLKPQLRVLSEAKCRTLFQTTLDCLDRIGVEVNNAEARDLLLAAGARADGRVVRIPPRLVQDAIAATPRHFTLWGRVAGREIHVAADQTHFGPGLTNTYFVDPATRARRQTQRGDPALTARIADALPNIGYVMGLGLIGDVRPDLASVYEFAELLANTSKPIIAWAHKPENVAAMYRMAVAAAGSEAALRERPSQATRCPRSGRPGRSRGRRALRPTARSPDLRRCGAAARGRWKRGRRWGARAKPPRSRPLRLPCDTWPPRSQACAPRR